MDNAVLDIEVRENTGTGNARAVRREGLVPGVLYGGGQDPATVSLKHNEVLKALNTGNLIGKMVNLSHKGKTQMAITQDIQFHPVSEKPLHIDFYRVKADSEITVEVGTTFINEDKCPGLTMGGTMNVVRYTIEVVCPAGAIPETLEVDLGGLEIGDSVHISDIKFPEGVSSAITDRDPTVLTIVQTRAEEEETEEDVDGIAGEEGAEGEAAEGEASDGDADGES
ncbi:MAG: 50S ribosomal protein L25/general stress protein Ctc [Acidimicrobiales bacterium]|nr:50S ribosomal protein L25/general stress protein Ctc [Hyphomonadaceae bacterium]RZV43234.1 MAG: 50S ribosomal protein L25/general stress protein Ctc [Acidimicrobiales bacterium]